MSTALVPLNKEGLAIVRAVEPTGFNELIASQHYLMTTDTAGKPQLYIKTPGLLHKLEAKSGGKAIVQAEIPTEEEERRMRKMMGVEEKEACVIMKGVVYMPNIDKPFINFGSARLKDTRNGKLLEMATTRATNRAIRLATNCGFTSVEELTEELTIEEARQEIHERRPAKENNPLIDEFKKLFITAFYNGDANAFDPKMAMRFIYQETGQKSMKNATNGDWQKAIEALKKVLRERQEIQESPDIEAVLEDEGEVIDAEWE